MIANETPVEELQRNFRTELTVQMKKAARQFGCPVEQLKYRVANDGVVEIARMDEQEAEDRMRDDVVESKVREIKKARGRFYG